VLPEDERPGASGSASEDYRVHLCFGPNCTERGSRALMPILERAVREAGLSERVEILATTCRNRCDYGPSLNVYPGPVFYNLLDQTAIREIVERHLGQGNVADQWLFRPKIEGAKRQ
jgi:NADP-reducing hydrogenase subunit HndC